MCEECGLPGKSYKHFKGVGPVCNCEIEDEKEDHGKPEDKPHRSDLCERCQAGLECVSSKRK